MPPEQGEDLSIWQEGLKDVDTDPRNLEQVFKDRLEQLKEDDKRECLLLVNGLIYWFNHASRSHHRTLWDGVREQIESMAEIKGVTPKEYVKYMFEPVQGRVFYSNILLRLFVSVSES